MLVVADARSDVCAHLYDAAGLVLLNGGIASPVVTLAAELSLPTVLSAGARAAQAGRTIALDGSTGLMEVRE